MSDAALDVSEDLLISPCATLFVGALRVCLTLGGVPLGTGEVEGVGLGEGRGERVPISTARSSVQARPRLRRRSSVGLSTTSSRVRWGTSRIRFTTCREGEQGET